MLSEFTTKGSQESSKRRLYRIDEPAKQIEPASIARQAGRARGPAVPPDAEDPTRSQTPAKPAAMPRPWAAFSLLPRKAAESKAEAMGQAESICAAVPDPIYCSAQKVAPKLATM